MRDGECAPRICAAASSASQTGSQAREHEMLALERLLLIARPEFLAIGRNKIGVAQECEHVGEADL